MRAVGRYKKILRNVIDNICSERDKYFVSPGSDFTRSGMIAPQDIFTSLLLMEDHSLSGEIIEYFGGKKDIPTSSAFIQARAKIKPEAFKAFFDGFVSETADSRKNIFTRVIDFLQLTVRILMCRTILMTLILTFLTLMEVSAIFTTLTLCTTFCSIRTLML